MQGNEVEVANYCNASSALAYALWTQPLLASSKCS
jgi:hypothetical protein